MPSRSMPWPIISLLLIQNTIGWPDTSEGGVMISIVTLLMVGLSSLAAYRVGTQVLKLPASRLRGAGRRVLEGLGLGVLFFTANVATWLVAILATRALTGW